MRDIRTLGDVIYVYRSQQGAPALRVYACRSVIISLTVVSSLVAGCQACGLAFSGYLVTGELVDSRTGLPLAGASIGFAFQRQGQAVPTLLSFEQFPVRASGAFTAMVPTDMGETCFSLCELAVARAGAVELPLPPLAAPLIPDQVTVLVELDGSTNETTMEIQAEMVGLSDASSTVSIDLGTVFLFTDMAGQE